MTPPTLPYLDLPPLAGAGGRVRLPGSKSISNRALLLAALAEGTTRLAGVLASDDTKVMIDALRQLGASIERPAGGADDELDVTGFADRPIPARTDIFLGNAGTAMRPLAAVLAVLAARDGGEHRLHGVARMHERPIGDLTAALRQLGGAVEETGQPGYPPLRIGAGQPRALDTRAPIRVRGDVSSQFLTALLLALPLASQQGAVRIEVEGELISKPYIEITLNLLARFGIDVAREGWSAFTIPADARYRSPGRFQIEPDASAASYFIATGALAAVDEPLVIEGLGLDAVQGDIRFVDAARAMGALVTGGADRLEIRRGAWPLKAIQLDATAIPDAAMTLVPMALYADGTSRITGIASWRVKETDRIEAMATEARKLGADVATGPDWIEVTPPARWKHPEIATYDDHRIAMCFALAAFEPKGGSGRASPALRILEPQCVGKTFPGFFPAWLAVVQARSPQDVPVITIDGPTASGKGTLAAGVAERLGWNRLDSGVLYRATALAWLAHPASATVDPDADLKPYETLIASLAAGLALRFVGEEVLREGPDGRAEPIGDALRQELTGVTASRLSALPAVREALHARQLAWRRPPGLVADGRDMGTVVFPEAPFKVFLTASASQRAERRHKQLISKGIHANIAALRQDLEERDARDKQRSVAPLKPAEGAWELDNSGLGIDESIDALLSRWEARVQGR